jgi:pimeloyl-ACP methyl ester carboxylesterase
MSLACVSGQALLARTPSAGDLLAEARRCQRIAAERADADDEACVDWYFEAAYRASQAAHSTAKAGEFVAAADQLYRKNLQDLLGAGQYFGRLDPTSGLLVQGSTVPVTHHGFVWQPADFQYILPPDKLPHLLRCRHTRPGCGVPLVVQRCRQNSDAIEKRFLPRKSPFAATAVLRFARDDRSSAVLEFYDPLRVAAVPSAGCELPLAADLTAPLAEALRDIPRTYLAGFVQPSGQTDQARLNFLEPYQPGKVPLVLIHGLFSDPHSWADMTNDLRATPGFCQRFQIWMFRYPTGQGFLRSAATLRAELAAAVEMCDPAGTDPALRQMVLVGHSMGGLIAKLQVTHSQNTIWRRLSKVPLDQVVADDATRARLAAACFFEPAPHVRRVIFIASPHCGSTHASELMGRLASHLVKESCQDAQQHGRLMADNPGVFSDAIQNRLPTSVDTLRSDSHLLAAMKEMQIRDGVTLHNVIGIRDKFSVHEPSDGVVPLSSAEHPHCASELVITAAHADVHRMPEAAREVVRILMEHLTEKGPASKLLAGPFHVVAVSKRPSGP